MTVMMKASVGLRRALRAPAIVKACTGSGLVAGLTLGVMLSAPIGVIAGVMLGLAIGVAAGVVMDREEKRRATRPEAVEDIAGLTPYAPPVEERLDGKAWLEEWLTPPPPQVG